MSETRRLCLTCVQVTNVDGAAIAVTGIQGSRELVYSTNSVAQQLDELQFVLGEGPCIDALAQAEPVLIPDLAAAPTSSRWPGFAQEAVEIGARAAFAFPLQAGSIRFGVLELYRSTPGPLSAEQLSSAKAIAGSAVTIVLRDVTLELARAKRGHGDESGRVELHRATGMIAVQLGVSLSEALARLRAAAFATQTPILQISREVLARTRRFTDGDQA